MAGPLLKARFIASSQQEQYADSKREPLKLQLLPVNAENIESMTVIVIDSFFSCCRNRTVARLLVSLTIIHNITLKYLLKKRFDKKQT